MVKIRSELPRDAVRIHEINSLAFRGSLEAELVDLIRFACSDMVSLVAEVDAVVVGHILFSPVHMVSDDGRLLDGMALEVMSVLPKFQGQKISSDLVSAGLRVMELQQYPFVIVVGLYQYYRRFGFVPAVCYGFQSQWEDLPEETFLIRILDYKTVEKLSGTIRYRDAFDVSIQKPADFGNLMAGCCHGNHNNP